MALVQAQGNGHHENYVMFASFICNKFAMRVFYC